MRQTPQLREPASNSHPAILIPAAILLALVALASGGCRGERAGGKQAAKTPNGDQAGPDGADDPFGADADAPVETAAEALQRMVDAYSQAGAYQDQAIVRLTYTENGAPAVDEARLEIAFQRDSGSLRAQAYQVDVCCDGGRLQARLEDPATANLDNQVIESACPQPLQLNALFNDALLAEWLGRGLAGFPMQLELLLGDDPLNDFTNEDVEKGLEEEGTVDGQPCYRVVVGGAGEQFRFWIDKQSFLLRRLDYPTDELMRTSTAKDMRLTAEFRGARWQADRQRFQFPRPQDAKVVRYFVPPPQPLPSELYGKRPAKFHFTGLDGERTGSEQLAGKPTVLLWYADHLACRAALEQVSMVRERWGESKLNVLAVCTEPGDVSNDQVSQMLRQWRVDLPVARDLEAFGRDVFQVPNLPTLVVLDADGKLHVFDVGFNENLPQELDLVLNMLQEGQDVAAQVIQRSQNEQAAYRQDLVSAGAEGIDVRFPLAERSEPEGLTMELAWESAELKLPGNLVAYNVADGSVEIAVLDGLRTVAVFDARGQQLSARELDLPPGVGVSLLRTGEVGEARYYLVSDGGGDQVYLYDAAWKRLAAHPVDPLHGGILDAMLLSAKAGPPRMLIGYREAGLHAAGPTGTRLWANRDCPTPNSIDAIGTAEGPRILATDPTGMLHVFTPDGESVGAAVRAAGMPLYHIFARRFETADSGAALCGVSYDVLGQRLAVGLDFNLSEVWRQSLPGGSFPYPVRWAHSGLLMDRPCWVLAGTDGSLHVIAADGATRESFNYGESIRGLAVTPDQRLLVATESGLRCWSVKFKPAPSE